MRNFITALLILFLLVHIAKSQNNTNPFCINGALPEHAELGFGSFRYHVNWLFFDSAGTYNFAASDIIANIHGNSGIEPIIIFKCTSMIPDTSVYADTIGWMPCEKELWERIHDPNLPSAETSWFPADTNAWKSFLTAFVERYNMDGIDDYANLVYPFRIYQLEVEMTRVWCENGPDTFPQDYVNYLNMSYRTIKQADSNAIVKMAGWGSVDRHLFYLNYIEADSFPFNQNFHITHYHLDTSLMYQKALANWLYIFENADYDVLDIHCYGFAEHFPARAKGLRELFDPLATKPLWALEGGGPYRHFAEVFNPENGTGFLSPELVEENAAYVVRYYTGGIGSGFSRLAWHVVPEYDPWGQAFGDLDLLSIDYEKKPSYWTYKGMAGFFPDFINASPIPDGDYWNNPDITAYSIQTPSADFTIIWNLKDTAGIFLKGLSKQHIFPTIMGDSLWTQIPLNPDSTYFFQTNRIPLIFEGTPEATGYLQHYLYPKIYIYPNPANDLLYIDSHTHLAGNKTITLLNMCGAEIVKTETAENTSIIDISSFEKGIYLVRYIDNNQTIMKKIIKL